MSGTTTLAVAGALVVLVAGAGCESEPASCGPLADYCGCEAECQSANCPNNCFCIEGEWVIQSCDSMVDGGTLPDAESADAAAGDFVCPNYIASDENCSLGPCVKDWGAGASYCADECATTEDCVGRPSSLGGELVCHPVGGYCTPACGDGDECVLDGFGSYPCQAGACSYIP